MEMTTVACEFSKKNEYQVGYSKRAERTRRVSNLSGRYCRSCDVNVAILLDTNQESCEAGVQILSDSCFHCGVLIVCTSCSPILFFKPNWEGSKLGWRQNWSDIE